MRCSTAGQLCELIATQVHSFNHVNVATAFRKLLQSGRGGVSRGAMEGALEQLEACAVEMMPAFGPQQVANMLHVMAKQRYRPSNGDLLPALDARVGEVAGQCTPQNVANIWWA